MQFTSKLFFAVVTITVVSILISSGLAIRMANQGLHDLGEGAVSDTHQAAYQCPAHVRPEHAQKA
jgi:methyl-accepting chemotaxis protein